MNDRTRRRLIHAAASAAFVMVATALIVPLAGAPTGPFYGFVGVPVLLLATLAGAGWLSERLTATDTPRARDAAPRRMRLAARADLRARPRPGHGVGRRPRPVAAPPEPAPARSRSPAGRAAKPEHAA